MKRTLVLFMTLLTPLMAQRDIREPNAVPVRIDVGSYCSPKMVIREGTKTTLTQNLTGEQYELTLAENHIDKKTLVNITQRNQYGEIIGFEQVVLKLGAQTRTVETGTALTLTMIHEKYWIAPHSLAVDSCCLDCGGWTACGCAVSCPGQTPCCKDPCCP